MYGPASKPGVIVLTHGHFDHVGALEALLRDWDVPVVAHPLEMPFLTGRADYAPPDPAVGGGLMALASPLYSRRGIDLGRRVRPLPADKSVPGLPGWRWVPTPGHSPGHVSLFRPVDRVLLAGDAVTTCRQEAMTTALTKPQAVHGPPAYFTTDWQAAAQSADVVAGLRPTVLATGHGVPMRGPEMRRQLEQLTAEFQRYAVPTAGRYVTTPARADLSGYTFVPRPVFPPAAVLLAIGVGLLAGRR